VCFIIIIIFFFFFFTLMISGTQASGAVPVSVSKSGSPVMAVLCSFFLPVDIP
jgi:hypothetical protein